MNFTRDYGLFLKRDTKIPELVFPKKKKKRKNVEHFPPLETFLQVSGVWISDKHRPLPFDYFCC